MLKARSFGFGTVVLLLVLALAVVAGCSGSDEGAGTADDVSYVLIAADAEGDLFIIDATTGNVLLSLDVWKDDGVGNPIIMKALSGLAFDPGRGRLLAVTDSANSDCSGCIYAINPVTGEATVLNDAYLSPGDITDIAWSSASGAAVFVYPWDGTVYGNIDPSDGTVYNDGAVLGNSCCNMGMTFGADGKLYVIAESGKNLYTLDPTNNFTETLVGNFTYVGFSGTLSGTEVINSLTLASDGTIYGIMVDVTNAYLVTVDPVMGAPVVTWKADLPFVMDALVSVDKSKLGSLALQTGTIGGLTFTVVRGKITQAGVDQPITPVGGPAVLLFDTPISTLSTVPLMVDMQALGLVSDGGSMTGFAFTDVSTYFATGFAAGIERVGNNVNYRFRYLSSGAPTEETGLLKTLADASVELSLSTDIWNDFGNVFGSVLWHPDATPSQCSFSNQQYTLGTPDVGTGDRIGIRLDNATLNDIVIGDPVEQGC